MKVLAEWNSDRLFYLKKPTLVSKNHGTAAETHHSTAAKTSSSSSSHIHPTSSFLASTYTDCYFGNDESLKELALEDSVQAKLLKRRENTSVILQKQDQSYEFLYADLKGSCLSGIHFDVTSDSSRSNSNHAFHLNKIIEYAPLKNCSQILSLNTLSVGTSNLLYSPSH